MQVVRCRGKLAELERHGRARAAAGQRRHRPHALGDPRPPVGENAHPHKAGPVAVVHNGIIENHLALRAAPGGAGRKFSSETDTEIVAHLIDEALLGGRADAGRGACAGARAGRGRLRARGRVREAPRPDRRRQERVAAGARPRRGRELPRLRHPRDPRAHARGHLPRGRRHRRDHRATGVNADRASTARRSTAQPKTITWDAAAGREGRLQALHAQGDPRAAARRRRHAARRA